MDTKCCERCGENIDCLAISLNGKHPLSGATLRIMQLRGTLEEFSISQKTVRPCKDCANLFEEFMRANNVRCSN